MATIEMAEAVEETATIETAEAAESLATVEETATIETAESREIAEISATAEREVEICAE